MHLSIITPERVIFEGDVDSVAVPGKVGEFEMLNSHAAIVSSLQEGTVKIRMHSKQSADFDNISGTLTQSPADKQVYLFDVKGGVIEMSNNQLTILAN